jgi:selenocysteine lyase/cysteine desulfurase
VPCGPDGTLDPEDLSRQLRTAPARLVAMTHASNVCGTILPIAEAARLAHQNGALILVDAAQTAGVLPIDVAGSGIDLLAFPGHKGLLGPTGTGGLYVAPGLQLTPLRQGGTGTRSEQEHHPKAMPEALEPGTVNTTGIAGLGAALRVLQARPPGTSRNHEAVLTARLLDGLKGLPGLHIHGPADPARQVAVVSITIDGWEPVDLAAALDSAFGIAVRPGLHCAPAAHHTLGTLPQGTVRLSPGPYTTDEDIDQTLTALRELAATTV